MYLSVPHNWQPDLVDSLKIKDIAEFYGKLDVDILGGGRPSNISPHVSRAFIERQINKIHKRGMVFNYLLNGTCLANTEVSGPMRKELLFLFDWLEGLSVEAITISMPYLSGFIKKHYPRFLLNVSTMAQVDSPDKAKFWEDLGAKKITLYEVNVNRNFDLIVKIRRAVKCELQLIVNNGCLYNCPLTLYHGLLCSHASQKGHALRGFIIDFYRIFCSYLRAKDPVNFIRADWIRPEDTHYYESLGIDSLKIVNRGMSTGAIRGIVTAYSDRSYEGNLLDLLPSPDKNINFNRVNPWYLLKFFLRPQLVNVFKLIKMKKLFTSIKDNIYIDNKKLDGFILSLQNKKCDLMLCDKCQWCAHIAAETVMVDSAKTYEASRHMEEFIEECTSGKLFKYL